MQWGFMVDIFLLKFFLFIYFDWFDLYFDFNVFVYQYGSEVDFYVGKFKNLGYVSFMDIFYMVCLFFINEVGIIDKDEVLYVIW